jgi:hypothetical protein
MLMPPPSAGWSTPTAIVGAPLAVAVALGAGFLASPAMGTDLSAQVARADFFDAHGWAPIDFGWYGGVSPHGYSLVTPPLMAWLGGGTLGPRLLGVAAVLVGTVALAALLVRTAATRPVLGGVLGAVCMVGNLVSGRITYAVGVTVGLGALLALASGREWMRYGVAPAVAALAAVTSPVAGLFVGLAGAAWAISGLLRPQEDRATSVPAAVTSRTAVHTGARGIGAHGAAAHGAAADGAAADGAAADGAAADGAAADGAAADGAAADGTALDGIAASGAAVLVRRRARVGEGLLLAAGAAVPGVAMAVLFGAGGWMNIGRWDTARAAGTGLVVALLVSRPAVRIGAALSVLGVLAAYAVHTPVGLNATRLAAMFALPTIAAYARIPARETAGRAVGRASTRAAILVAVLAAVTVWQPPVMVADLRAVGDPAARPGYFRPLTDELARRAPVGRVEIVPLANYWEAAYVPPTTPLARGWLRQADLAYNSLFFDGTLDDASYERWLRDNGVSYVALADARPSWVGRAEAALVRGGLRYLTPVWRGGPWTLYEVSGRPSIAPDVPDAPDAPDGAGRGRLVASTPAGVTLDVPAAGDVAVRVRFSSWLAVRNPNGTADACLRRAGDWTVLTARRPGRYEVTSSFTARGPFCPERAEPARAEGHR